MKIKPIFIISVSIIALLSMGLPHAKSERLTKSFNVESGGTLILDSDLGSVEIESHSSNVVDIKVHNKGTHTDNFKVNFSQDGNDVKISGDIDRSLFSMNGFSSSVRFIIKVPEQYNVDLSTGGGSIELSNLKGSVDARTSGGSINLGRIDGDVEAKTSGGSIHVDEVLGNINAHTSGGSIKAKISTQPTKDSRLTTSGGSVTAYLSPSIAVDLKASTSGGRVRSDINVSGTLKKTRIEGTINGGGPELYLKTSGGSVNIKEI